MAVLNDYPGLKFCKHVSYTRMKSDYCINAKITINMFSTSALLRKSFHVYVLTPLS